MRSEVLQKLGMGQTGDGDSSMGPEGLKRGKPRLEKPSSTEQARQQPTP